MTVCSGMYQPYKLNLSLCLLCCVRDQIVTLGVRGSSPPNTCRHPPSTLSPACSSLTHTYLSIPATCDTESHYGGFADTKSRCGETRERESKDNNRAGTCRNMQSCMYQPYHQHSREQVKQCRMLPSRTNHSLPTISLNQTDGLPTHSLFTHSFTHSLTHSINQSLTQSLTASLTHSFTH